MEEIIRLLDSDGRVVASTRYTSSRPGRAPELRSVPKPSPQPGYTVGRFAKFAVSAAHQIMGRPTRFEPPELRWYEPNDRPEALAYVARQHPETIHLSMRLSDAHDELTIANTIAHEARHLKTLADGEWWRDDEADAVRAGDYWGPAIVAAHRASSGELYRIYVKSSGPEWDDLPRWAVVLYKGHAWDYQPMLTGRGRWLQMRNYA